MGTIDYSISTLRVYDDDGKSSGTRILVDRIWPRGLTKADVGADCWLKDAAPSTELRKWFSHDPSRWDDFMKRYHAELDRNSAVVEELLDFWRNDHLVLLYSARDTQHNQAVALAEYLRKLNVK